MQSEPPRMIDILPFLILLCCTSPGLWLPLPAFEIVDAMALIDNSAIPIIAPLCLC